MPAPNSFEVITCPKEMQAASLRQRALGKTVGFVPTMGYLHAGHISLIEIAKKHCDWVVVSIFVNPTQFNDPKDLEKYPRNLSADLALLEQAKIDALFLPEAKTIYPDGFQTSVKLSKLTLPLEGKFRPGHFDGVATVVSILFNSVLPNVAVFGEKDFQQLRIIEQMVSDLQLPIKIIRGPTLRETDGLAMSSRNVRLNSDTRKRATQISSAIFAAKEEFIKVGHNIDETCKFVRSKLTSAGLDIEYVEVVNELDLCGISRSGATLRLLVAVVADGVRLIDNIQLN